jgi:hypothetical protein
VSVTSTKDIPSSSDEELATPPRQQPIAQLIAPSNTATNAIVIATYTPERNGDLTMDLKPHATTNAMVKHPAQASTAEPINNDIDIDIDDLPDAVFSPGATVVGFDPTAVPPNPRPVKIPGSPKKIWPNRVTAVTTPGTMIAFLHLPKDRTRGVHESCLTRIENSEAYERIKKTLHFVSFPPMVSTTDPEQALSNNRQGGDHDQDRHCILRVCQLQTPIDNSMVDTWGETIAKLVEHFSKGEYTEYVTLYRYVGNITPPTTCPLSCYIPLANCTDVMVLHERNNAKNNHTNPRPLTELLQIPELAAKYFLPAHLTRAQELALQATTEPNEPTTPGRLDQFLQNLPGP